MDQRKRTNLPSRRSIRLRHFDYSSNAAYVVTICTHQRRPLFRTIVDGELDPSWLGKIVEREWYKTAEIRPGVLLDAFILMPNHLHGILILNVPENEPRPKTLQHSVGAICARPFQAPSLGLEAIMRGFKSAVTSTARKKQPDLSLVWQRGFFDRIIRDEPELNRFRKYIADNPQQWELDRYFERSQA